MKRFSISSTICVLSLALSQAPYAPSTAAMPFQTQEKKAAAQPELEAQGNLTGRVIFKGKLPKQQDLLVPEEQAAGCAHGDSKVSALNMRLLVHADMGIANAVVTIEVPGQEIKLPKQPIVLDQVQCRFDQHVIVVPLGAKIEYRNSDDVSHNLHTYSRKNKGLNRTLSPHSSFTQEPKKAEVIRIGCDIHPWMRSYLFVSPTSYYALTDEHGAFSIPGLPPGEYEANIWHESLGTSKAKVSIDKEGNSKALEVTLSPRQKRKR
jgi:plastocyanin